MNYIGSKYKLLPFIHDVVNDVVDGNINDMVFCDLFAGTGIVGRSFKTHVNKVISNDIEYYSYVLNKNYIWNHQDIANKSSYLEKLNSLPLIENGFIYKNYCLGGSGGRMYFSDFNGKKIDTARRQIEVWKDSGEINEHLYYFLLCSLIESADKHANTASVYGAYLKKLKKTALRDMHIEPADFEVNRNEHEVYQQDANQLITHISGDILYLDPPYNSRQYGANYHLLNTIAEYKPFVPKGMTGLRDYTRSKYCSAGSVREEFETLIANADFHYILLSYNNEGLMSVGDVRNIMERYGRYSLFQQTYQRFKADKTENRMHKADSTVEYIHVLVK